MAADVKIDYATLNQLNSSLKQILVELEQASKRSDALEHAIDRPCGESKLRDKVGDFESGWNDRRSKLAEDIAEVQQHVEAVGKGWKEWDDEASKSLSTAAYAEDPTKKK